MVRLPFPEDLGFFFGSILRVPVHGEFGFTFASLRSGCATEYYRHTRNIDRVRWHLRHKGAATTLENYVQELPAALAKARMPDASRALILSLAAVALHAISDAALGVFGYGCRFAAPQPPPPQPLPRRRRSVDPLVDFNIDGGNWVALMHPPPSA